MSCMYAEPRCHTTEFIYTVHSSFILKFEYYFINEVGILENFLNSELMIKIVNENK